MCIRDRANIGILEGFIGANDVIITYYRTETDATNATNPLSEEYRNSTAYNDEVYARIQNSDDCFEISKIDLIVNRLPGIEAEGNVVYCQNFFPETIELSSGLETIALSDHSYLWSTGATTSSINVNEAGEYSVVVTSNTTDCSKTRTITVDSKLITPASLDAIIMCDDDGNIDGVVSFELEDLDVEITGGNTVYRVSYFLTENDAENSVNELNKSSYQNGTNPQTIHVKVLDPETLCYALTTVNLNVSSIQPNTAVLDLSLIHI